MAQHPWIHSRCVSHLNDFIHRLLLPSSTLYIHNPGKVAVRRRKLQASFAIRFTWRISLGISPDVGAGISKSKLRNLIPRER
jgi:hypothetical protein